MLNWIVYMGEPPTKVALMIAFTRVLLSETTLVVGDLVIVRLHTHAQDRS